jgi:hypothetical protein
MALWAQAHERSAEAYFTSTNRLHHQRNIAPPTSAWSCFAHAYIHQIRALGARNNTRVEPVGCPCIYFLLSFAFLLLFKTCE